MELLLLVISLTKSYLYGMISPFLVSCAMMLLSSYCASEIGSSSTGLSGEAHFRGDCCECYGNIS